jgi:uncharacterized protein
MNTMQAFDERFNAIINELPKELNDKYENLRSIIKQLNRVVIGFSGGVDSSFLLKVCVDILNNDNVLAVIGRSDTYPIREFEEAQRIATEIGATIIEVETKETDVLKFKENPPDRCYFCKTELFSELRSIADANGIEWILDGTHADDAGDFRPGMRAVRERGVRSPLLESGLGKADIRELSRMLGLSTAEKPSFACLSSRFPYGMQIDKERLRAIDDAENFLYDEGFRVVRVRHHDNQTARIEVGQNDFPKFLEHDMRTRIIAKLHALGFTYITLDLEGFRSGSMNAVLSIEIKKAFMDDNAA